MKFWHTMMRVKDLDISLDFFINKLWLFETSRRDSEIWRFTNVFLGINKWERQIELTYNWDNTEDYSKGKNMWHIAFEVENIYETCEQLMKAGIIINRPPRDGYMAFINSPDNVSIELLQTGDKLELKEPWLSMENIGSW